MSEEIVRKIRVTHTVEFIIKAKPDPGSPQNFLGYGLAPKTAEEVVERIIAQLQFEADRGRNPTMLTSQYGGYYDMRSGSRTTTIEVLDEE